MSKPNGAQEEAQLVTDVVAKVFEGTANSHGEQKNLLAFFKTLSIEELLYFRAAVSVLASLETFATVELVQRNKYEVDDVRSRLQEVSRQRVREMDGNPYA